jgi:hypothetical protein
MTRIVRVLDVERLSRRRLFARLTNTDDPDACWVWTGYTNPKGYGQIGIYDRQVALTHRVAYVLHHGVDPAPLLVRHGCDNPPCCNPSHLRAGTSRDNSDDMKRRGRTAAPTGERSGRSTIPDVVVQEIRTRAAAGESKASIGRAVGVHPSYVGRLVRMVRRVA